MKHVYLDYAAATPVSKAVLGAMQPYFSEIFYNPSALYVGARGAKQALDDARSSVARSIGSRPGDIVFTAGGTESTNLAIKGVMQQFPDGEIIISAVEHEAVRRPAQNYNVSECKVDAKGRVLVDSLATQITDKTVFISVMYANNEIGSVQPIKDIVELAKAERAKRLKIGNKLPIYVHTDACQAPQYLDVNVARLGVDLMTLNGSKMYGPKQSGILYLRTGAIVTQQIQGGGQEFALRSGTENLANAVGFAKALDSAVKKRSTSCKEVGGIAKYFISELISKFGANINGHKSMRLPNNINATFAGVDNERVLFSLDQQGIAAASGSACSASNEEVSHVLSSIGLSDSEARSSLRFSIGRETTKEDIDYTIKSLKIALKA